MERGKFDGSYFGQFGEAPRTPESRTSQQNARTGSRVMSSKEYSEYKKQRKAEQRESARSNEANLRGAYQKQKKKIGTGLAAALAVVGITALAVGGYAAINYFGNQSDTAPLDTPPAVTATAPVETPTQNPEIKEARGVYDGYGETGMWVEANGVEDGIWRAGENGVKFADASKLAEICDHDEVEMVKYTTDNEVESLGDYVANIASRVKVDQIAGLPDGVSLDDFSSMSIVEADEYLESMDAETYDAKKQGFDAIMDLAFTRPVVLNGEYDNAFMPLKDAKGGITHENMQLAHCKTKESGTPATEFYWLDKDGNEVGSIIAKIGRVDNGGAEFDFTGCTQVVNKKGTNPDVYKDVPEIKEDGTPEDNGGGTPEEHHDKEDDDDTGGGDPEDGGGTPEDHHEEEEDDTGGGDPEDGDDTPDDGTPDDGDPEPGPGPGPSQPEDPGDKPDEKPAKNTEAEIENAGPRAEVVTTPGTQTEDPADAMARDQEAVRAREEAEHRQAEATRAAQEEAERRAAEEAEARREAAAKEAAEREAREAADREAARQAEEARQAEAARATEAAKAAEEAAAAEQAARAAAEQAARDEAAAAAAREAAAEEQAAAAEQTASSGGESAGERAGLSY